MIQGDGDGTSDFVMSWTGTDTESALELRRHGGIVVFRLGAAAMSSGDGTAGRPLDFTAPPPDAGAGAASPGVTLYYQYWYRDAPAGPPSFNLSNGLAVTYCP